MFNDFPDIDFDSFPDELKQIINRNESKIDKIASTDDVDYSHTIAKMEDMENELNTFFSPLSNLNSTLNSPESQKAYDESIAMLSQHNSFVSHHKQLFELLQNITTQNEGQQSVLENMLRDFRLSGAHLPQDKQKELEAIDLKLSELSSTFSQNLLKATAKFEIIIDDPSDVEGIPQSDLKAAKELIDGKSVYKFTLQIPSYIAYMTYGPNRILREKLYKAYTTRAPENEAIIDEILSHRTKKAEILGFDSYAEYALQTRDANKEEDVLNFLESLIEISKPQAKKELDELKEFAKELDGVDLEAFDTAFYSEKLKKEKYGYDDNMTKPYFEQGRVLDGLIRLIEELFGVKFKKINKETHHPSIKIYDIYEEGELSARIYFDLEARKEKRGGAWMQDWETHFVDSNGTKHLPSAFVVTNFPSSDNAQPSLLRHDDVVTLFHEMGHAIHHLFSKQSEYFISGINGVAWDVVEFPSQFLENFAYEELILKRFAFHYQTNEPIPDELLSNIKKSKNFHAALGVLRQIEFSMFDFLLHQKLYQGKQVQDLLDMVREKTTLLKPPPYNRFQQGFSHIFAGGYAAGYYSYKWAEVFSADAFFACLDPAKGINPHMADGYKKHILSSGAIRPMNQLYQEWIGSKPSADSLSRLYELTSRAKD